MIPNRIIRYFSSALFLILIIPHSSGKSISARSAPQGSAPALGQHVISFLQSGRSLEELPPSHSLYPMRVVPSIATTTYLIMGHDPSMLKRFYPSLRRVVMQWFNRMVMTENGLVTGPLFPGVDDDTYLSPGMNALANLELFSLHLIASGIGEYEDALELLSLSRRMSESATEEFYESSRDFFFLVTSEDKFLIKYAPEQLLVLLLDRKLGAGARRRVIERFLGETSVSVVLTRKPGPGIEIEADELLRPLLIDLLREIPELRELPIPKESRSYQPGDEVLEGAHGNWFKFWLDRPCDRKGLFSTLTVVSSLTHVVRVLESRELLDIEDLEAIKSDLDSLHGYLSKESLDLVTYQEAIGIINRQLSRMSGYSSAISSEDGVWQVFDESKWNHLPPRTRMLITDACERSIHELMEAKSVLSGLMMKGSGIVGEVSFPEMTVATGKKVNFVFSLASTEDSLSISSLYLQIGEIRRKLAGMHESITLAPGTPPFVYRGSLALPPNTNPGIVTLPLFFDFIEGGKRIEIHGIESICLSRGYNTAINFLEGRRLDRGPVKFNIVLKYTPDHDIQGTLDGTILKELRCNPELPAKFLVRKGSSVTTLPLEIITSESIPPGRYPVSLSLMMNGRNIARFDENLVKPIRWLYIGPFSSSSHVLENAVTYHDDLFAEYRTGSDLQLRWSEVPPGVLSADGAVLPERLIGANPDCCIILYTVFDIPVQMKVQWRLETADASSLWINSDPILKKEKEDKAANSSVVQLRKGINSILIATCWDDSPAPVLFEISEENGFPVPGLSNEINRIFEGFERLASLEDQGETAPQPSGRLYETNFSLNAPEAFSVSVIGSFNNWVPGASPMENDGTGTWTVKLLLAPGTYSYKFLIDQKKKIRDPECELFEPDGFGGLNSIITVP